MLMKNLNQIYNIILKITVLKSGNPMMNQTDNERRYHTTLHGGEDLFAVIESLQHPSGFEYLFKIFLVILNLKTVSDIMTFE